MNQSSPQYLLCPAEGSGPETWDLRPETSTWTWTLIWMTCRVLTLMMTTSAEISSAAAVTDHMIKHCFYVTSCWLLIAGNANSRCDCSETSKVLWVNESASYPACTARRCDVLFECASCSVVLLWNRVFIKCCVCCVSVVWRVLLYARCLIQFWLLIIEHFQPCLRQSGWPRHTSTAFKASLQLQWFPNGASADTSTTSSDASAAFTVHTLTDSLTLKSDSVCLCLLTCFLRLSE